MTLPEIRFVKYLVETANWLADSKRLDVRDWDAFRVIVFQNVQPELFANLKDKQIERCLRAAFAEVNRT